MLGNYVNVVYNAALGECGVRYCAGRLWCTILPCGIVVYDAAFGGAVVCDTTPMRLLHHHNHVPTQVQQLIIIIIYLQRYKNLL